MLAGPRKVGEAATGRASLAKRGGLVSQLMGVWLYNVIVEKSVYPIFYRHYHSWTWFGSSETLALIWGRLGWSAVRRPTTAVGHRLAIVVAAWIHIRLRKSGLSLSASGWC